MLFGWFLRPFVIWTLLHLKSSLNFVFQIFIHEYFIYITSTSSPILHLRKMWEFGEQSLESLGLAWNSWISLASTSKSSGITRCATTPDFLGVFKFF